MLTVVNTLSLHQAAFTTKSFKCHNRYKIALMGLVLTMAAVMAQSAHGQEEPPWKHAINGGQVPGPRETVIDVQTTARVYVPGHLFSLQVKSVKPVAPEIIEAVQAGILEGLKTNDRRLQRTGSSPDTLIDCTIIYLAAVSQVQRRTRPEYQKTGEISVYDPDTEMYRTEDQFGYVDVPYQAVVLEGGMTIECEARDKKTGIVLYADRFDPTYSEILGEVGRVSAPSVDMSGRVSIWLAKNAAALFVAQVIPFTYPEVVQLPSTRKLKESSRLLKTKRWSEALALLGGMAVFKDTRDEAYRLYSIGVSHEALAYGASNPAETTNHLEAAVANYRRATTLRPREVILWPSRNRAEFSLRQTSAFDAQVKGFMEATKTASRAAGTDSKQSSAGDTRDLFHKVSSKLPPAPVITNETVIEWVKSGLTQDYVEASIRNAPDTKFDVSPAEVERLQREGVSGRILKVMRDPQGQRSSVRTRKWLELVYLMVPLLLVLSSG